MGQDQEHSQPAPIVSPVQQAQGAGCPAAAQEPHGVHGCQTRASQRLNQHTEAAEASGSEQGFEASGSSSDADTDGSCDEDEAASSASEHEAAPEPLAPNPKPKPKGAPTRKRRSAAPCMHFVSASVQQQKRFPGAAQLAS